MQHWIELSKTLLHQIKAYIVNQQNTTIPDFTPYQSRTKHQHM